MFSNEKLWRGIAGLNGFMAIVMGAVAAHDVPDSHLAAMADKASIYQLIHAGVLLWLASQQGKPFGVSRLLFLTGIILFCGTLYLKSVFGLHNATKLAPMGGISFMLGWLVIIMASLKSKS